jgi:NAD(P)-dependent dehydrogenase (short-subunit alcohol dehydrogenase family)
MTREANGRVAVITGASRGLGAGLAAHFAAQGVHLGLCARHQPAAVRTKLTAHDADRGASTEALRATVDVTDRGALDDFVAEVLGRFGRIDLWVNNAGLLGPIGPLAGLDPAEVARTIEVNVVGVLHASAAFAAHVRSRRGPGVLVNISSGAATTPYVGWAAYCASKAAVEQLTRVVALEEAPHGLVAYAVSPGIVDTDMQAAARAADEADFPQVERFRRFAVEHAFNSPAWVGSHILALAFGGERPQTVSVRVPDQPGTAHTG